MNKHNIIAESQYGFQKKKSTEQALVKIRDKITTNIEEQKYTVGLFLDFKKAFDSIDREILLRKLDNYGIRGIAKSLLQNYL